MSISLYYLRGSPYAWRVQLALEHKGIDHEIKTVDMGGGETRREPYASMNPRGKVPVMTDGDFSLYESVAMMEYLEDKYPDTPNLYPEDAEERARVRRLVCEMDNYWFPPSMLMAQNLYFKAEESDWNETEIKDGTAGLLAELKYFEGQVLEDSFAGNISAADLSIYPMLAHLARYELRRSGLGLTEAMGPKLRKLMARVESQSYFNKTFPQHWR